MHYVGLDIHKKTISYCVKRMDGTITSEGEFSARRQDMDRWMETLPQPWTAELRHAEPSILQSRRSRRPNATA
jgi:hypothetical protein